jgi:hypothetical protein
MEVGDPPGADGVADETGQIRVALEEPAPLGDAVGLVAELFRGQLVKVVEDVLLEDVRVQRGHAVHAVAAHDGERRHEDPRLAVLLDDRTPARQSVRSGGAPGPEAPVDS